MYVTIQRLHTYQDCFVICDMFIVKSLCLTENNGFKIKFNFHCSRNFFTNTIQLKENTKLSVILYRSEMRKVIGTYHQTEESKLLQLSHLMKKTRLRTVPY